jgi:hypothetical protein
MISLPGRRLVSTRHKFAPSSRNTLVSRDAGGISRPSGRPPRSLYNLARAAVALHQTGRTDLNRIFGAAIMLARIQSVLINTVEEHP